MIYARLERERKACFAIKRQYLARAGTARAGEETSHGRQATACAGSVRQWCSRVARRAVLARWITSGASGIQSVGETGAFQKVQ